MRPIGQPPGSIERSRQVRQWIVALAENFGEELSAARIDLIESGLTDLTVEQVQSAFRFCALRRERFFPSLGELRKYVDGGGKTTATAIEDELGWHRVLDHCREHVRVDLGQVGPPLPDNLRYAARAANGLFYLECCSEHDLIFAKQRFLEALARYREGVEHFAELPDGPAKRMIAAAAEQKRLPASQTVRQLPQAAESDSWRPTLKEVRDVLCQATGLHGPPEPPKEKPEPEPEPVMVYRDDRRVENMRRQLEEHLVVPPLTRADAVGTGESPR